MTSFDPYKARADFPILATKAHGKPLVYLDSAASAQKPRAVMDAMIDVMESSYANVHRGIHYLSNKATDLMEASRARVADFLGAGDVNEVIFTRGATEAVNLVAYGWAMDRFDEGDEIILSVAEHHANIVPWHFLRERKGVVLKWVPLRADHSLDMEAYQAAFTDKTKLVAMGHMSNALGTINPVKQIVKLAKARNVPVLLDGCQAVPHFPVDVQELGCDFYVFSAHKLYGPTGVGALWARAEILDSMSPFQGGGEMIDQVAEDAVTYGKVPHRFEAGTPAIVEIVSLTAAIDYLEQFDRGAIMTHERALLDRTMAGLANLHSVETYGNVQDKGAIVSFNVRGAHASDVATLLDRQGVAVRSGHHCAQPLMARLGVTATARASFGLYNTAEDVDAFLAALEKAEGMLV